MTARIFIGPSRTGGAWHYVPWPGTAFPIGACGSNVDRRFMHAIDRPDDGIAFHSRECVRCRSALTREDS
jgi:hypothetical protein